MGVFQNSGSALGSHRASVAAHSAGFSGHKNQVSPCLSPWVVLGELSVCVGVHMWQHRNGCRSLTHGGVTWLCPGGGQGATAPAVAVRHWAAQEVHTGHPWMLGGKDKPRKGRCAEGVPDCQSREAQVVKQSI